MSVRIYPDGSRANIGDKRLEVEWFTMRDKSAKEIESTGRDFDPDNDTIGNVEYFKVEEHELARKRATEILNAYETNNLAYGVVTITEQRVEWFVEEDNVGSWENVGEPEYLDSSVAPAPVVIKDCF